VESEPFRLKLETENDLRETLKKGFGLTFPERGCCPEHVAPFDALCEAFFAPAPITVWHATRGSGKTMMLAALASLELLGGFNVVVLGGSGEQSRRVHEAMGYAWRHEISLGNSYTTATDIYLATEPGSWVTKTKIGNWARALMASQRSARGPHPHRLRLDEADEMDLRILDAAMGQTLTTDTTLPAQTVIVSTHQHESGTMTEVLKRANDRGWPVRRWCWREVIKHDDNPGSWLPASEIERKRTEVSDSMWRVEYELETPSEGGSVFSQLMLDMLFRGEPLNDMLNQYYEIESPKKGASYITSADWARKRDLTAIATLRVDCAPARLVAYERRWREPWPLLIRHFNDRMTRYPGKGIHDATGLGDVVASYIEAHVIDYVISGRNKSKMFIDYETAAEKGDIVLPRATSLMAAHRYCLRNDLYGTGHPPDEIVAIALAWQVAAGRTKFHGGKPLPIIRF